LRSLIRLTLENAVSVAEKNAEAINNKTNKINRAKLKAQLSAKNLKLNSSAKYKRGTKKHHLCPSFWSTIIISKNKKNVK
jgi:hypothetical protein